MIFLKRKRQAEMAPVGKRFGRLSVIGKPFHVDSHHRNPHVVCECECSKITVVSIANLTRTEKSRATKSCGCLRQQVSRGNNLKHGLWGKDSQHKRLIRCWRNMMDRCYLENDDAWEHYGGKGIIVFVDWHDPKNFVEWAIESGYNDNLTIDRIDADLDYIPSNCRWVPLVDNIKNMHTARRKKIDDLQKANAMLLVSLLALLGEKK